MTVHTAGNPPGTNVLPAGLGLPETPSTSEPVTGVRKWPKGMELWKMIRREMGEHGVVGMPSGMSTGMLTGPEDVYAFADDPKSFFERREWIMAHVTRRMERIAALEGKPVASCTIPQKEPTGEEMELIRSCERQENWPEFAKGYTFTFGPDCVIVRGMARLYCLGPK